MEVKLEFLRWVQVVQDDETTGRFVAFDVTEVDALGGEGRHRTVVVKVSSAEGQILVELHLLWFVLGHVVAVATESQSVGLHRWPLNVADLDWQVKSVLFGFQWSEESEDVADLI